MAASAKAEVEEYPKARRVNGRFVLPWIGHKGLPTIFGAMKWFMTSKNNSNLPGGKLSNFFRYDIKVRIFCAPCCKVIIIVIIITQHQPFCKVQITCKTCTHIMPLRDIQAVNQNCTWLFENLPTPHNEAIISPYMLYLTKTSPRLSFSLSNVIMCCSMKKKFGFIGIQAHDLQCYQY